MPYASLACDMTSASEVAVAAWGALQVLYAFAFAFAFLRTVDPKPPQTEMPFVPRSVTSLCVQMQYCVSLKPYISRRVIIVLDEIANNVTTHIR